MHLPEGRFVLVVLLDQLGLMLLLFPHLLGDWLRLRLLQSVKLSLQFLHKSWVGEWIVEVHLEDWRS